MSVFQSVGVEVPVEHAQTRAVIVRDTDRASAAVNTLTGPRTTVPSSAVIVAPLPHLSTTTVVVVEMVAAQERALQVRDWKILICFPFFFSPPPPIFH